jgi:hypothetical protein
MRYDNKFLIYYYLDSHNEVLTHNTGLALDKS